MRAVRRPTMDGPDRLVLTWCIARSELRPPAMRLAVVVQWGGAVVRNEGRAAIRSNVSAQLTAHSMLRRDRTGMVSTINEVDTTDERSLKPFET